MAAGCGDHGYVASMAGPAYPFERHTTDTVSVQAFRDGTKLTLVNATATSWGPARLWLNQRFSRAIGGLLQVLTQDSGLNTALEDPEVAAVLWTAGRFTLKAVPLLLRHSIASFTVPFLLTL